MGKKKKILHTGKLIVFAVLIAGTLIFSLFFKDKLISTYLKKGLETVFDTQVDVTGLHAKILSSRLTIDSLAAADKDNPENYLFVLRNITIDVDSTALLKGKIIIEKLESTGFEKGIPRQNVRSGNTGETDSESKKKEVNTPSFNFPVISLDPKEIIKNHKNDFLSFKLIEDSKITIDTAAGQLKNNTEVLQKKFDQFRNKTDNLFMAKVTSVKEGKKLLEDITAAGKDIKTIREHSRSLYREVKEDTALIKKEKNRINETLNEDYRKIDSFIAEPGSSMKHAASAYAQNLLKEKTGRYYGIVLKGLAVLKNLTSEKSQKNNYSRRKGRTVRFPEKELPLFLLKKASITMIQSTENLKIDMENISSNPILIRTPALFSVSFKNQLSNALLKGTFNLNNSEDGELKISGTLNNFCIDTESVQGRYNASGDFSLIDSSVLTGRADIELMNAQLQNPEKVDFIEEINTILEDSDGTALKAEFYIDDNTSKITVTTSLDALIKETVDNLLADISSTLKEQAKKEFEEQIKPHLTGWDSGSLILKNLFKEEKNISTDIESYNKKLKAEENRIKKELIKLSIPETGGKGSEILNKASDGLKLPF